MKNLFLIAFVALLSIPALAQKSGAGKPDYRKKPYWIEMIKDPHVNYFEALKAYDTFWKGKKKPVEENEVIGQEKKSGEKDSKEKQKEALKEKELYKKYGLDCKKFEHWKMEVKPYVQADGSILTKEQQLKMWEDQKK